MDGVKKKKKKKKEKVNEKEIGVIEKWKTSVEKLKWSCRYTEVGNEEDMGRRYALWGKIQPFTIHHLFLLYIVSYLLS